MLYSVREDSILLKKYVKEFSNGKKVLDVGTGSGVQALAARDSGAKEVLALDINKEAVEFVKKKGIRTIHSNLLEKVKGKYDLIIFNPPYLPRDKNEDAQSELTNSGGKNGDEIILRFIKQVKKHLNESGIILMVWSSLTPMKRIEKALSDRGFKKKVLEEESYFMEKLEVVKIVGKALKRP